MLDKQIGWFHEFSDLPREQLAAEATARNRAALSSFVEACLSGKPVLDALSSEDFAECVFELRASERAWNRALGDALIRADEVSRGEAKVAAATALHSFADSCPWSQFREIALDQAASYEGR